MNKTLYIRDEDAPLWERARELSNDRLSPVIVESLRKFVADKEAELRGVERIVIEYNDAWEGGKPTAKAFLGRWLIDPRQPYMEAYSSRRYAIADTPKGGVVIFGTNEDDEYGTLEVFSSFDDAFAGATVGSLQRSALHEALRRRGVPVEELDV